MSDPALLVLEDGAVFRGKSIGARGAAVGEVVFNTSITGYQEILTDPSYARQIVTLTYPHIGNVGANPEDEESRAVFCSGLVIRDLPRRVSNWRSSQPLDEYLARRNVVAISDIDTRKLTRLLREMGAQNGCIMAGDLDESEALEKARAFPGLNGMDLAKEVTVSEPYAWNEGSWALGEGHRPGVARRYDVVAYDFGVKHNILRLLAERGCRLTVVPARTPAAEVLALDPDGIFLANGPGDPEPCDYAIDNIQRCLETDIPLFGICLGHQLFSLACGARSFKMKTGHHGANHPVQHLDSGRVLITSQNHGFAVADEGLPKCLRVTHRSLFDGTIQGVERTDKPAFSFQGHPEASPGPHDIRELFDRFVELMAARREGSSNA
ncbi:MAG: glutamine-hydrolyzing carbamoyl-phosphate synthase small subunit [Pseudomonadota bacterium]|nr:glutamine-hydrolyzing carbamoyl-phosphate synthase small subunit [Pseudomonadota bacterium]